MNRDAKMKKKMTFSVFIALKLGFKFAEARYDFRLKYLAVHKHKMKFLR